MGKDMKDLMEEIRNDDIELFGEHKTREQIKAEEKVRKEAERKAMREVAKARREAAKQGGGDSTRRDVILVAVVMAVILLLGVAALAFQFLGVQESEAFDQDENRTVFVNEEAMPEEDPDGVTAALTHAYFTKGGYLCVRLLLANGTEWDVRVDSVDIVLYNATDTIASAKVVGPTEADSGDPFEISSEANRYYEFYIAPEHIFLKDDSLSEVGFTTSIASTPLEE